MAREIVDILEDVKAHLRVTWKYQDDEIMDMIDEGQTFIDSICGVSDYEHVGPAFSLLKSYCRYAWSGSVELFEENYKRQLLRLQIVNGLGAFKEGRYGKKP